MKILYVTTISNTINAFLIPHIKMLIEEGHKVDVACNIEQEINPEIINMGCKLYQLPFQRSPLKRDNYRAYKELRKIIENNNYNLVHTHTPVASAIVRFACKRNSKVNVYYTAHGFHFYKGAPLLNWVIYYPVEKYLAKFTDTLITINKEDYNRAKKNFNAKRIEYIPGVGIDLNKINSTIVDKNLKSSELNLPKDAFVVLSVGELNKNKNHEVVFKAIAKLNKPNIHYVICGQGKLYDYLKGISISLNIESQVHLLGYRNDVAEIYKIADLFAFPSYREGLSVALMEAMANGLPVVCSNIRGNKDLIEGKSGGFLFMPSNIEDIIVSVKTMYNDLGLIENMGLFNMNKIGEYSINNILDHMKLMYRLKVVK